MCKRAHTSDWAKSLASVVTGASDPRFLERLIPHLEAAVSLAPKGRVQWTCLGNLADGLLNAGRADKSLTFYEQAGELVRIAAEAGGESAQQASADYAWIAGNWATALSLIGDSFGARELYLVSAEAFTKAGRPEVHVIGMELEALRLDIAGGDADSALLSVNERLANIEDWWRRVGAGEVVPAAPDSEVLARALIGGLDIAKQAHIAMEQWDPALQLIDSKIAVKEQLGRSKENIAIDRVNRDNVLIELKRFPEAKQDLNECLEIFHADPARRAAVLSTLANLYYHWDDIPEADIQQRRALAVRDGLSDPSARAISHNNLANYLRRSGASASRLEADCHQLAALSYRTVAALGQDLKISFNNYAIDLPPRPIRRRPARHPPHCRPPR